MGIREIKAKLGNRTLGIIGEGTEFKSYSVVIPLVEREGKLNILFEVRAKHLRSQPGEISFPGGGIEGDEEPLDAAIRETCEELGMDSGNMEVVGRTDILITHHNKIIYPFVALIREDKLVNYSEAEVDHIFYVPVEYFFDNEPVIRRIRLLTGIDEEFPFKDEMEINYRMAQGSSDIYFYRYKDYVIWGLTAKILSNFIKLIKEK